jgi:hypothetical protein
MMEVNNKTYFVKTGEKENNDKRLNIYDNMEKQKHPWNIKGKQGKI